MTIKGKEVEKNFEDVYEYAVQIADRLISIQECENGYDYTIYDLNYNDLDGGVYDDPDITIKEALDEIIIDLKNGGYAEIVRGNIKPNDVPTEIDYDTVIERAEAGPEVFKSRTVMGFKARTMECFQNVEDMDSTDIEDMVREYVEDQMIEHGINAEIEDVVVSGSRCRGLENETSDIDVVVELTTSVKEDYLFNILHENNISIGDYPLDINPITAQETGTLDEYLPKVEQYLSEKRDAMTKDTFEIYQLQSREELRDYRFEGLDTLRRVGKIKSDTFDEIKLSNYNKVYEGDMSMISMGSQANFLESIYMKFNIDRPDNFRGHSLSVSDVIVLHQNGKDTAHYVDSFGFKELPNFCKQEQKNLENTLEEAKKEEKTEETFQMQTPKRRTRSR